MKLAQIMIAGSMAVLAQAVCLWPSAAQEGLAKIKTIVVIYGENRSFDHMYGFFPGANGIANATNEQKRSSTMTASRSRSSRYSAVAASRTRASSGCQMGRL